MDTQGQSSLHELSQAFMALSQAISQQTATTAALQQTLFQAQGQQQFQQPRRPFTVKVHAEDRFTGKEDSVREKLYTLLQRMERAADLHGDVENRIKVAVFCDEFLAGEAQMLISDAFYNNKVHDLEQVKQVLMERFGGFDDQEAARLEIWKLMLSPPQDIATLITKFRAAITRLPNRDPADALSEFRYCIRDVALKAKLTGEAFTTWTQAANAAAQYTNTQVTYLRAAQLAGPSTAATPANKVLPTSQSSGAMEVDAVRATAGQQQAAGWQVAGRGGRGVVSGRGGRGGRASGGRAVQHSNPTIRCYKCNGRGHISTQCPSPSKADAYAALAELEGEEGRAEEESAVAAQEKKNA